MAQKITDGGIVPEINDDATPIANPVNDESISFTAVLLSQGKHRFYTLAMQSELLAETCVVDPRYNNPLEGFQRRLDEKRALEIADYIDKGFGTIPGSIVLSAQKEAQLQYTRKARTLSFRKTDRSFLILDGQHRVYGFHLAKAHLRVPVVIYNDLTRAEEARLFMDINTKQRPVPPELILDIKRMAETESDVESVMRDVFDTLNSDGKSSPFGLLSPSEKAVGKISRATFNQSLKSIWPTLGQTDAQGITPVLDDYLHACLSGLRESSASDKITNPTLFRALIVTFPNVAQRVSDRFDGDYSRDNFRKVMTPLFANVKKTEFQKPGASHKALSDTFQKGLSAGFRLGKVQS